MRVVGAVGQGEEKPAVRDHCFRITAVACPAMKLGVRAQVLLAAPTKRADAAGEAQPCRADPHARRQRPDRGADFRYAADDFVTGTTSSGRLGKSPSTTWRSVRQTPHAHTSMTTSVGCFAVGQERRRPTSCAPTASQTIAE